MFFSFERIFLVADFIHCFIGIFVNEDIIFMHMNAGHTGESAGDTEQHGINRQGDRRPGREGTDANRSEALGITGADKAGDENAGQNGKQESSYRNGGDHTGRNRRVQPNDNNGHERCSDDQEEDMPDAGSSLNPS